MKASIDPDKCIGCGLCARFCPQGIDMSSGKAAVVKSDMPCLEKASEICPVSIIIIT